MTFFIHCCTKWINKCPVASRLGGDYYFDQCAVYNATKPEWRRRKTCNWCVKCSPAHGVISFIVKQQLNPFTNAASLNSIALNLRDKVLLLGRHLHCAQEGSSRWKDRTTRVCSRKERFPSLISRSQNIRAKIYSHKHPRNTLCAFKETLASKLGWGVKKAAKSTP